MRSVKTCFQHRCRCRDQRCRDGPCESRLLRFLHRLFFFFTVAGQYMGLFRHPPQKKGGGGLIRLRGCVIFLPLPSDACMMHAVSWAGWSLRQQLLMISAAKTRLARPVVSNTWEATCMAKSLLTYGRDGIALSDDTGASWTGLRSQVDKRKSRLIKEATEWNGQNRWVSSSGTTPTNSSASASWQISQDFRGRRNIRCSVLTLRHNNCIAVDRSLHSR